MADLKLKIKKQLFKRKVEGQTKAGYIGKVITSGKAGFDEIARESAKNTTLHPKEASLAAELLLEGVCAKLKQGFIVDLGQRTHIGRIEDGAFGSQVKTIQQVAEALGMTVDIIDPGLQDLAPLKRLTP